MVIIMETILTKQKEFFLTGEESNLKPMTLKNIADVVFLMYPPSLESPVRNMCKQSLVFSASKSYLRRAS